MTFTTRTRHDGNYKNTRVGKNDYCKHNQTRQRDLFWTNISTLHSLHGFFKLNRGGCWLVG